MINFQYLEVTNVNKSCEILGSHGGNAEDSDLLSYDAVSLG
jgi:hypothetical protein